MKRSIVKAMKESLKSLDTSDGWARLCRNGVVEFDKIASAVKETKSVRKQILSRITCRRDAHLLHASPIC